MTNTQPIIEFKNLVKDFRLGFFRRRVEVVKGLTLSVQKGEIFGFLGPNGAGKTTSIKVLMGLIEATSGEAKLFGLPANNVQAKARVGFLPEHPYFYEYLTGFEFLNFYARLFNIPRSKRIARVERLLELVGLSHAQDVHLRKYSKGMIQRIGIAQSLLNDPDLVILDEPMSGLDPIGRKDVRDIIFSLKEQGKTVFFSSHILQDVEMICDRVAILNRGKLLKVGNLSELLGQVENQQVELSLSSLSPRLRAELESLPFKNLPSSADRLVLILPKAELDGIIQKIIQDNASIESIIPIKGTLEDLFVQQIFGSQEVDTTDSSNERENDLSTKEKKNDTDLETLETSTSEQSDKKGN